MLNLNYTWNTLKKKVNVNFPLLGQLNFMLKLL